MKIISRQEARQKGLTRYYTGRACTRGHVAERLVSTTKCRGCSKEDVIKWKKDNRDLVKSRGRQWWRDRRLNTIKRLGGKCECCKVSNFEFLTLDHKKGGGNAHRRTFGKSKGTPTGFYTWAAAQTTKELKKILRVLCWNCNCAIGSFGCCPHVAP